jgi:hypothetical protein
MRVSVDQAWNHDVIVELECLIGSERFGFFGGQKFYDIASFDGDDNVFQNCVFRHHWDDPAAFE